MWVCVSESVLLSLQVPFPVLGASFIAWVALWLVGGGTGPIAFSFKQLFSGHNFDILSFRFEL